jgi:hypothetical protein
MIFGFGENKKAERLIWDIFTPQILLFESLNFSSMQTQSDLEAISKHNNFTNIYLNTSKNGNVMQYYTFDSPPFVFEFCQLEPNGWVLSVMGTKEYNRLVVSFANGSKTLRRKMEDGDNLFTVRIDNGVYVNEGGIGEKTISLSQYLISLDGYRDRDNILSGL